MNPEPSLATAPTTPALTGEAAAVAYVTQELPKARKALKRARVLGFVLIALVGSYISIASIMLVRFFQPQEAAQVASGMLLQRINSDGPALARQVEREVPRFIRQLPDYLIQELPKYRHDLEAEFDADLRTHCRALANDLSVQMDALLAAHQTTLQFLLAHPDNREAIRTVLPDLTQTTLNFLTTEPDGKIVQAHINDLAAGLKEIEKHMDRLANGTNLTPEEQKARRSLAVLAKAIKAKTKEPENSRPAADKLARK